jgi:pimeloyl-ACP methyl ester carboxylesterase
MGEAGIAPEEQQVEIAAGSIHLRRRGRGEPVLVLHHSTGCRGWEPLTEALGGSFEVLLPDLPGYGGSERPVWARSPRDEAILIGRLIDRLALPPVHVVGLGFGGWVAAELATLAPQRLATLTLVGAAGLKPRHGEIADQVLISYDDYVRQGFSDDAAFQAVFGPQPDKAVLELWDFSREMTVRLTWKPWMFSRQLPFLLGEVPTPALVVWGSEDRVVPVDCGHQYVERLPNARFEEVAAGHVVDLEAPERLAALIAEHVHAGGVLADTPGSVPVA